MTRSYLIFGDIEGKLDVLRVECSRSQRKGCYSVYKLIQQYGRKSGGRLAMTGRFPLYGGFQVLHAGLRLRTAARA